MERSWDYVVNSPTGIALAIFATVLVMMFIVAGGIFMRYQMMRQHERIREESELAEPKLIE